MRILALDIGDVRCGIAICDPAETIASPVCVLPTREVEQNAPSFRRVIEDWEPEALVCGLPLSMSGERGAQAEKIKQKAETIAQRVNLPLAFSDERLSSKEAKRMLREKGLSEKDMRGKVDMIAASLFLQSYIDKKNRSSN